MQLRRMSTVEGVMAPATLWFLFACLLAVVSAARGQVPSAARGAPPSAARGAAPSASQGAMPSVSSGAGEKVWFVSSPYRSLERTRKLLDAADLRVLLALGYEHQEGQIGSQLASRKGVLESRVYTRMDSPEGGAPQLEIAIVESPVSGFDLAVYADVAASRSDVTAVRKGLEVLARTSAAGADQPELAYEMFRLGHMEADRALSLLKALGYSTVEFSKSRSKQGLFELIRDKKEKLPLVIGVMNASKTSLLAPPPAGTKGRPSTSSSGGRGKSPQGAPQLGGSHLHSATSGSPEERLLLVYDRNDPEALESLVNLLQSHIDVAAQQIVIEALVIEVNTSRLRDLGVEFGGATDNLRGGFERTETGKSLGTFLFSRDSFTDFISFKASLEALAESGKAEVLSSPSVLVLNDRHARIQVGRQIPVSRTTAATGVVTKGIEYFPIGIVLNLRPRIDREGLEVTMQIETIISSISPESAALVETGAFSGIEFSPIIDNRVVETFVRVADGTPFIIGGLMSTNEQTTLVGVPGLANLPFLGRLFSRERTEREQREVIVVITPHIVPQEESSFSYLIPKDSDIFDRFDYRLFRNAYRVRDDDVWDLKFIQESEALRDLVSKITLYAEEDVLLQRREPFRTLLAGDIPGEDVLVRRMLGEIVGKLDYTSEIDLDKTFFFVAPEGVDEGQNLEDRSLSSILEGALEVPDRAVMLTFSARSTPREGRPFIYPVAVVADTTVPTGERANVSFLRSANSYDEEGIPLQWTIVLADEDDIDHLKQVLILKRLLELNDRLPLTLRAFRPGLQILFPTRNDMRNRYHLIDSEVAKLFYQTSSSQYYPAFERVFNRTVQVIEQTLEGNGR